MSPALCRCGQQKERAGHLSCPDCMAKVPADLRSEFYRLSRDKRGSPSYWSTLRKVEAALGEIARAEKAVTP